MEQTNAVFSKNGQIKNYLAILAKIICKNKKASKEKEKLIWKKFKCGALYIYSLAHMFLYHKIHFNLGGNNFFS